MVVLSFQVAKDQYRGALPRERVPLIQRVLLPRIAPPWIFHCTPLQDLHASASMQSLEAGAFEPNS